MTEADNKGAVTIALVNFHSGGKSGSNLLDVLKEQLGPESVFQLSASQGGPKKVLERFKRVPALR